LMQRPSQVIRPEKETQPLDVIPSTGKNTHDPFSFLLTLEQIEDLIIEEGKEEMPGIDLRRAAWEVADQKADEVTFRRQLPKQQLELTKRYILSKRPPQPADDASPGYDLHLEVGIKNIADKAREVAYRLDGPTGLPTEGWWYASRISRNWSGGSLRDVVARFRGSSPTEVSGLSIADDKGEAWGGVPLEYIAVDCQYFSVAMVPLMEQPADSYFQTAKTIRVGDVPEDKALKKLTNVSFRL